MARPKIKPPKHTKAQLMEECVELISVKFGANPTGAVEYLLNFFTGADLEGIAAELRTGKHRDVKVVG